MIENFDNRQKLILPSGLQLIADYYISDYRKRSWFERLFTLPWHPLVLHKYARVCYLSGQTILVSSASFSQIQEELVQLKSLKPETLAFLNSPKIKC